MDNDNPPFPTAKKINGKWTVELKTLHDLIVFINTYGSIVMNSTGIEIYDDYRE